MQFVSVIIPNYNHEPYLHKRIDSVLNQTYQNFEVIILDDCSTDNSKRIIESYRNHEKISHILYNEQNSGSTFKQWKKGLDLAKGEWIWIAESDDLATFDFLEKLLEFSKIHRDVGLIYSRSKIIDENGKLKKLYNEYNAPSLQLTHLKNDSDVYLFERKEFISNYMINENSIPNASAVLFKKKVVSSKVFNLLVRIKLNGDWVFWLSILQQTDLLYFSKDLNSFRHHSNNVRSTVNKELPILEYFHVLNLMKGHQSNLTKAVDRILYFTNKKISLSVKMRVYLKIIFLGFPIRLIKTIYKK
jgi:glycosyltransferase involved in cell wall biosynthesis